MEIIAKSPARVDATKAAPEAMLVRLSPPGAHCTVHELNCTDFVWCSGAHAFSFLPVLPTGANCSFVVPARVRRAFAL